MTSFSLALFLQLLIGHLQPRMSHVALYAHVTWAVGAPAVKSNEEQKEHSNQTFFLRLQDPTGFVDVKLHFNERWYLSFLDFVC